jgi:hypothetical protein
MLDPQSVGEDGKMRKVGESKKRLFSSNEQMIEKP